MHRGYVKLWRKIEEWSWYKDAKTLALFIHLLISANHKETTYQGHKVPRGSLVSGLFALSDQTGLSVRSIRTCLQHLKTTQDLTIKTTSKFSIISIVNFEQYQEKTTSKPTNDRQAIDKRPTTSKECKELKNLRSNTLVRPSSHEVRSYFQELNAPQEATPFFDHFESNGWLVSGKTPMKDWKAACRNWLRMPYRNTQTKSKVSGQLALIESAKNIHEEMQTWQ